MTTKQSSPAKRAPRAVAPAAVKSAESSEKTVTFQGRVMAVKLPTGEQLAAWQRIITRLEDAKAEDMSAAQALKLLDRAARIIDSVLVDEADIDWLEDGRIDGTVQTQEALSIVVDAVKSFGDDMPGTTAPNRAARRRKA